MWGKSFKDCFKIIYCNYFCIISIFQDLLLSKWGEKGKTETRPRGYHLHQWPKIHFLGQNMSHFYAWWPPHKLSKWFNSSLSSPRHKILTTVLAWLWDTTLWQCGVFIYWKAVTSTVGFRHEATGTLIGKCSLEGEKEISYSVRWFLLSNLAIWVTVIRYRPATSRVWTTEG